MQRRDYEQLKDLISDQDGDRIASENVSETCWKQQKTKEVSWNSTGNRRWTCLHLFDHIWSVLTLTLFCQTIVEPPITDPDEFQQSLFNIRLTSVM